MLGIYRLRPERAHARHGSPGLLGQGIEQQLQHEGDEDDGQAPVAHHGMRFLEQPEQRLRDDGEPGVVGHAVQLGMQCLELVLQFRPDEQVFLDDGLLARLLIGYLPAHRS